MKSFLNKSNPTRQFILGGSLKKLVDIYNFVLNHYTQALINIKTFGGANLKIIAYSQFEDQSIFSKESKDDDFRPLAEFIWTSLFLST